MNRNNYKQFITPVFCKDTDDFNSIMKIKSVLNDKTYQKISQLPSKIIFLKNDTKYYYLAIYNEFCGCSWSYDDFIVTDNFKDNPRHKEIIKDAVPRFYNKETIEDFCSTIMHVVK